LRLEEPLEVTEQGVRLSSAARKLLGITRKQELKRFVKEGVKHVPGRNGLGCPMAHQCVGEKSPIQELAEAYQYVYSLLPSSEL
jgi:hypothetical protein